MPTKTPTGNKVGTQLLMSPHSKTRAGALALVREESQAEMLRVLVDASLERFESTHAIQLDRLHAVFRRNKIDPASAIEVMLKDRIKARNLIEMDDAAIKRIFGVSE